MYNNWFEEGDKCPECGSTLVAVKAGKGTGNIICQNCGWKA